MRTWPGRDIGDGGLSTAALDETGKTGMRSVFPWAVSPQAPVARALLPLASVSVTSSPVSPRCAAAVIRTLPALGPVVMVDRVPSNARMSVDPVVREAVEGGVGQLQALSHVGAMVSLVAGPVLTPEVGDVGLRIRSIDVVR